MTHIVEFRLYKLRAGVRDSFAARFDLEIRPMLERRGIAVLAAGPSLHDADSYYLIRAFADGESREAALAAFYGSSEWMEQHEDTVMQMIDTYNTATMKAEPFLTDAIRNGAGAGPFERG